MQTKRRWEVWKQVVRDSGMPEYHRRYVTKKLATRAARMLRAHGFDVARVVDSQV